MVVAGVFALTKKGDNITERKNTYKIAIIDLVTTLGPSYLLRVPNARRFLTNSVIDEFIINLGQFISVFQSVDCRNMNLGGGQGKI